MRLFLTLMPEEDFPSWAIGKHSIQAMLYYHLTGTKYGELHGGRGFKFFCFSDIFPGGSFKRGETKNIIVSSPEDGFIETLNERLSETEKVILGRHVFTVKKVKTLRLKPRRAFITGSPVVVNAPEGRGRFFTFHEHKSLAYFIERLTENALAKYTAFTGESIELDSPIFTRMVPKVRKNGWIDVYVRVNIRGKYFDVSGSNWERLEVGLNGKNHELYTFLMDAGIGILNSLGFGFLNPLRS